MRKLYLVNQSGASYFFDYRNATLINSISNLGVEKNNEYVAFTNSQKLVESKNALTSLTFGVIFLKGYEGYNAFLKFIRESTELRLFYDSGINTKFANVAFKSISKTELDHNSIQSTLVLDKLSLWLIKSTYKIEVKQSKTGKVYSYPYPYTYSTSYDGEISVRNNGENKAALNIVITGCIKNPKIDIIRDGVVTSSMELFVSSVYASTIITVNSEEANQYMEMTLNGKTTNIYDKQNFEYDNFLFLEPGESIIRFNAGMDRNTVCSIQVIEEYGGN